MIIYSILKGLVSNLSTRHNDFLANIKKLQDLKFRLFIDSDYTINYENFGVFTYRSKNYPSEIDLVKEYKLFEERHDSMNINLLSKEIAGRYPGL